MWNGYEYGDWTDQVRMGLCLQGKGRSVTVWEERIKSIQIGLPEPERPDHVRPNDTWHIPVGVITLRERNLADQDPVFAMDGPQPGFREVPLKCPVCHHDREFQLRGRWGDPVTITCADGHSWQFEDTAYGVALLKVALVGSRPDDAGPHIGA